MLVVYLKSLKMIAVPVCRCMNTEPEAVSLVSQDDEFQNILIFHNLATLLTGGYLNSSIPTDPYSPPWSSNLYLIMLPWQRRISQEGYRERIPVATTCKSFLSGGISCFCFSIAPDTTFICTKAGTTYSESVFLNRPIDIPSSELN